MRGLRKYYRQIRNNLPCGGSLKHRLMKDIASTIRSYLLDNPDADIQAIHSQFGSPQQIVAAYLEEMDTKTLLSALLFRRKITRIMTVICGIALTAWLIVLLIAIISGLISINGYYIVELG